MKRIFILGRERSGTKWLTNLVANHETISCVQSETHTGVLETNMLERMEAAFGDLRIKENRIAFYHCFKQTAFYRLTGMGESFLDANRSHDYLEIFVQLMDRFALQNGSTGWVQKANSLYAEKIYQSIPDVQLIVIQRDPIENLLSKTLRKPENAGLRNNLQHMLGYAYAHKYENRFCRRHQIFKVQFNELKTAKAQALQRVCQNLGLDFSEAMLVDRFRKNTTFTESNQPNLDEPYVRRLRLLYNSVSLLPFPLIKWYRNRVRGKRAPTNRFAVGTFDL